MGFHCVIYWSIILYDSNLQADNSLHKGYKLWTNQCITKVHHSQPLRFGCYMHGFIHVKSLLVSLSSDSLQLMPIMNQYTVCSCYRLAKGIDTDQYLPSGPALGPEYGLLIKVHWGSNVMNASMEDYFKKLTMAKMLSTKKSHVCFLKGNMATSHLIFLCNLSLEKYSSQVAEACPWCHACAD